MGRENRIRHRVRALRAYDPPPEGRRGKLRLDFNENTLGCSPKALAAIRRLTAEDLSLYPEYGDLVAALSRHLRVAPEQVLPVNGTDEAIKIAVEAFLEPGTTLLLPSPTFVMFKIYAELAGGRIKEIPYHPDMSFPVREIRAALDRSVSLIGLANPNNPTGTAIPLPQIAGLCRAARRTGALVLVDEAYHEFYGQTALGLLPEHPNLLITRTFSKAYGLASLRVGCVVAAPDVIEMLRKVRSPYSVTGVAVAAAVAALKDHAYVRRYAAAVSRGRRALEHGLRRRKIPFFPSAANFLLADVGSEYRRLESTLGAQGILVRERGGHPLTRNCVRIGVGTPAEMQKFLAALDRFLADRCLLFDMDGVLVDVRRSYHEAIRRTVRELTGRPAGEAEVRAYKARGFNDDWALTHALARQHGAKATRPEVIRAFQRHYLGHGDKPGLIDREHWLFDRAVLRKLAARHPLGIVTGRPRDEARYALDRAGAAGFFRVVVAREDLDPGRLKPQPDGILLAWKLLKTGGAVYFGDNVDDMAAAGKAGALAVGVLAPGLAPRRAATVLRQAGADRIIAGINHLGEVLP